MNGPFGGCFIKGFNSLDCGRFGLFQIFGFNCLKSFLDQGPGSALICAVPGPAFGILSFSFL